jgi:hypothetical protein
LTLLALLNGGQAATQLPGGTVTEGETKVPVGPLTVDPLTDADRVTGKAAVPFPFETVILKKTCPPLGTPIRVLFTTFPGFTCLDVRVKLLLTAWAGVIPVAANPTIKIKLKANSAAVLWFI